MGNSIKPFPAQSWSHPLDAPTYAYKYASTRVGTPGLGGIFLSHPCLPQLMTHQSAWEHVLTSFSLLTRLLTLGSGTSLLVLWLRQPFKAEVQVLPLVRS